MEDIKTMQAQLMQSHAENQKLRTQLQGLICLVRKAWTGDHSAAIDVAVIVGVAPPTLEISSATDEIVAVPKVFNPLVKPLLRNFERVVQCRQASLSNTSMPPAINNWLKLTIGLINKEYKEKQIATKAKQLMYLRERETYMDEQMDSQKCDGKKKLGEVERRTNSLHYIVKREDEKRKELKEELEKNEPHREPTRIETKRRIGSGKRSKFKVKQSDEGKLSDCLVVQPQSERKCQGDLRGRTKGTRPNSAVCVTNAEEGNHKRSVMKRPVSAQVPSVKTQRKSYQKCRSKGHRGGRLDHQLVETEKDITLTINLLQERLGIDRQGMV